MRLFVVIFALLSAAALAQDTVTLQSLLRMRQKGYSDVQVISVIRSAKAIEMRATETEIDLLKAAGLSQAVVDTVLNQKILLESRANTAPAAQPPAQSWQKMSEPAPVAAQGRSAEPATLPAAKPVAVVPSGCPVGMGVYYHSKNGWIFVESVQPGNRTGGILKAGIVPFQKIANYYVFYGKQAPLQLSETKPEFCVRNMAISTRDIHIAELTLHKGNREIEGSSSTTYGKMNLDTDAKKLLKVDAVSSPDGVVVFRPQIELLDGEYALIISSGLPTHDFGIRTSRRR